MAAVKYTKINKPYSTSSTKALMSGPDECFSIESSIEISNGTQKSIEKLLIGTPENNFNGDSILLRDGSIAIIVGIHKSINSSSSRSISVSTENEAGESSCVVLCPGHMLITPELIAIPASYLQIGDKILSNTGLNNVTKIDDGNYSGDMVNISIASKMFLEKLKQLSNKNITDWLSNALWSSNLGIEYCNHIIYVNGLAVADQQFYSQYFRKIRTLSL